MAFAKCHIKGCIPVTVPRRDVGVLLQQQPHRALMTIASCL
eukprot:CAMPEP_0195613002 /NCGR_PEP_ID=MMETSP0815-20121206/11196_1 /TAXON_ID=97485 /ORGANISM="Prymnesium parvum, Strain Texoma1" /LENGTH=40 /DNA_ID= /DNA_START= /DNA_END= /DNA_ORIENTATION=